MNTHTSPSAFVRCLKILGFAAAFSFCTAALQAQWSSLLEHTFDSEAEGDLDGTTVQNFNLSTDPAAVTGTWVAQTTHMLANGSFLTSGPKGNAQIRLGDYIDNAKGNSNALFRLTGTFNSTAGWLTMGFSTREAPNTGAQFTEGPSDSFATFMLHSDGTIFRSYLNLGTGDDNHNNPLLAGEPLTLSIELDYRNYSVAETNYGTIRWYLGSDLLRTVELDDSANRPQTLLFTKTANAAGEISSLSLQQIPEPASAAALMALLVAGLCLSRRRRLS